jgi:hypothetical protein
LFSRLAQDYQPRRTLILAHREELITQAVDKLRVSTGIEAQVVADSALDETDLAPFDVVWLCNVQAPSQAGAKKLEDFVAAGGGLVVTAGALVDAQRWNELLWRDGQGLLPMPSIPMPSIRMPGMPMPSIPMPGMPMPGMDPPPPPGWLPMPPSPSQFPIGAQGSSRFGTSPADGSVLFQLPADLQGARASADLQRPLWRGVLDSAERLTQLLESARVQQPPLAETDLIAQIQSLVAVFVRVPLMTSDGL